MTNLLDSLNGPLEETARRLANQLDRDVANWLEQLRAQAARDITPLERGELDHYLAETRDLLHAELARTLLRRWQLE